MMGLPTEAHVDALAAALHGARWASVAVLHFTPRESMSELEAMVENAGSMVDFGYEITLPLCRAGAGRLPLAAGQGGQYRACRRRR